jgi:hypothetical protein
MPIKNIKSKGMLKNRHEPLVLAGAVALTLLAIASWGWVWEKLFAGMLVASAGYLNMRLTYYCLCEHSVQVVEKRHTTWREFWEELVVGFKIHMNRWLGLFILISGSVTFLISKDGNVAAIATMIAVVALGVLCTFEYTKPVHQEPVPSVLEGFRVQKYLDTVKKEKKKFLQKRRGVRRGSLTKITLTLGLLFFVWGLAQGFPIHHQGYSNIHGVLAVGAIGAVYFWANGINWIALVPMAWVPFWYGLEYFIGIQLLPWGNLDSGFGQGYLPFFLALTLALETYGGFVRRKLFKVSRDDRPFFEDTAVKRQW